jgi:hypothetical protein
VAVYQVLISKCCRQAVAVDKQGNVPNDQSKWKCYNFREVVSVCYNHNLFRCRTARISTVIQVVVQTQVCHCVF